MPKGLFASIVSKSPAPEAGGGESEDMDKKMSMGAKQRAAKSLISAVSAGDAAGAASAFKRMYDLCASEGGSEDYEGE